MTRTIAPRGNRLLRRLAALLLVLAMILSGSVCAVSAATLPFEVNSKEFKHTFYTAAEGLDVIRFSASEF